MAGWGMGVCLADDMGLGKTVQALAALAARASLGPALVVAPTSVCFNWVREAQRFTPGLSVHLFHEVDREAVLGSLGPGQVLVTSWGLLARNEERLSQVRFATHLDESRPSRTPRPEGKGGGAIRPSGAGAERHAIENHLGELGAFAHGGPQVSGAGCASRTVRHPHRARPRPRARRGAGQAGGPSS
jgi:hypothetical protein